MTRDKNRKRHCRGWAHKRTRMPAAHVYAYIIHAMVYKFITQTVYPQTDFRSLEWLFQLCAFIEPFITDVVKCSIHTQAKECLDNTGDDKTVGIL